MSGLDPRGRCDSADACGSAECARCSPPEECGICGTYHRPDFDGDCRDGAERFNSPDAEDATMEFDSPGAPDAGDAVMGAGRRLEGRWCSTGDTVEFVPQGTPFTQVQNLAGAVNALAAAVRFLEAAERDLEACEARFLFEEVTAQIEQDR